MHEAGKLRTNPQQEEPRPSSEVYACMQCEKQFLSKGGCGAHLFKVHGKVNPVRHLFDQTSCGACLKEYHTFSKLKAHILASRRCRHLLQGRRARWAPAPGSGSAVENELVAAHDGLLPPLQAQGPWNEERPQRPDVQYDLDIIEELCTHFLDVDTLDECEQIVRNIAKRHAVSWATFTASLAEFLEMFTTEDAQVLRIDGSDLRRLLSSLCAPTSWTFLHSSTQTHRSNWHGPMARLEQACIEEISLPTAEIETTSSVPRGFGRERYILHLFAGRRRRGDFQFYVDSLQHLHGDFQIYVLSVDIAIDARWGDLSNEDTRSFWIKAIHDKQIVALLGGASLRDLVESKRETSHLPCFQGSLLSKSDQDSGRDMGFTLTLPARVGANQDRQRADGIPIACNDGSFLRWRCGRIRTSRRTTRSRGSINMANSGHAASPAVA